MQLKLAPERLDQRRERALVASLGPLEFDGHRINDTRSLGNGPPVRSAASRCLWPRHNRELEMELMQKQHRKLSSALARVFAVWRTGLPRPVLVLQGGWA